MTEVTVKTVLPSMKLTKLHREMIVNEVMTHRFKDQTIKLIQSQRDVSLKLINTLLAEFNLKTADHPASWYPWRNNMTIHLKNEFYTTTYSAVLNPRTIFSTVHEQGSRIYFNLPGWAQYVARDYESGLTVEQRKVFKDFKLPYKAERDGLWLIRHDNEALFDELETEVKAHVARFRKWQDEVGPAMTTLRATLDAFSTTKQLIETWPEITSFVQQVCFKQPKTSQTSTALVQLDKLNTMFALPA